MWPWEHLALGYVCYSAYRRFVDGERPDDAGVVVLALATQLPDLIDKPLAWTFDVLPSGLSLGHSVFFALPISLLALLLARRTGRPELGAALAIGYLSHLAGDVLYYLLTGGVLTYEFLLWPLVDRPDVAVTSFSAQLSRLLASFGEFLATPQGQAYLALEALVFAGVLVVWYLDDLPPFGLLSVATADETDELRDRP